MPPAVSGAEFPRPDAAERDVGDGNGSVGQGGNHYSRQGRGALERRTPLVHSGNSKYWFRRVGKHPVFEPLRTEAAQLAADAPPPAAFLVRQAAWDALAFVDLCEASYEEAAPCHDLCRRVQRREYELLLAFCFERAVGS